MSMIKTVFSVSALLAATLFASVSANAGDPALGRQAMMKLNDAATGVLAGMVKGQTEFEAVKAQQALNALHGAALAFGYMFQEGSESSDKYITDMGSLKSAFGAAASNCGSCHKAYRTK